MEPPHSTAYQSRDQLTHASEARQVPSNNTAFVGTTSPAVARLSPTTGASLMPTSHYGESPFGPSRDFKQWQTPLPATHFTRQQQRSPHTGSPLTPALNSATFFFPSAASPPKVD